MTTTKAYVGERTSDGVAQVFVEEVRDGQRHKRPLRHIARHSPAGFEWGHFGSGPADLANAILSDLMEMADGVSQRMYQKFKFEVVGNLDREDFRMSSSFVQEWLSEHWSAMAEADIKNDLVAG